MSVCILMIGRARCDQHRPAKYGPELQVYKENYLEIKHYLIQTRTNVSRPIDEGLCMGTN